MRSSGRAIEPPRIILDTNVLLSALLFDGVTSRLVELWQSRRIHCLISKPILEEYITALAYPKFELTDQEIHSLIEEEFLPYAETVRAVSVKNVPFLKDSHDRKFLECAGAGKADFLLTGDKELLSLKRFRITEILQPGIFLRDFFQNLRPVSS